MFSLKELESDSFLNLLLSRKLTNNVYKVDTFIEIYTIKELLKKLSICDFIPVKKLHLTNRTIYKIENLGLGYMKYISLSDFNILIECNKISRDIPIHLKYIYGNVFSFIDSEKIDLDILITDNIYALVDNETKSIWNIFIGKPTNPNRMYYKQDLDCKHYPFKIASKLEGIQRVEIDEVVKSDII